MSDESVGSASADEVTNLSTESLLSEATRLGEAMWEAILGLGCSEDSTANDEMGEAGRAAKAWSSYMHDRFIETVTADSTSSDVAEYTQEEAFNLGYALGKAEKATDETSASRESQLRAALQAFWDYEMEPASLYSWDDIQAMVLLALATDSTTRVTERADCTCDPDDPTPTHYGNCPHRLADETSPARDPEIAYCSPYSGKRYRQPKCEHEQTIHNGRCMDCGQLVATDGNSTVTERTEGTS